VHRSGVPLSKKLAETWKKKRLLMKTLWPGWHDDALMAVHPQGDGLLQQKRLMMLDMQAALGLAFEM
jgi:hypothetical protein